MRAKLYTQGRNECVPINVLNVIRTKFWIILNDEEIKKLISDAEKAWIWTREWWAIFKFYYNWFTGRFYQNYWIELEVETFDIMSDDFEARALHWERFWLWLLYAWSWYRNVREDLEITFEEVENSDTKDEKYAGHHLFWSCNYIVWIWASIDYEDRIIKFKLNVLREAVRKGFMWATARTFTLKDKILEYYLMELNKWTVFEWVEFLDERNRTALDLALKLRIVK